MTVDSFDAVEFDAFFVSASQLLSTTQDEYSTDHVIGPGNYLYVLVVGVITAMAIISRVRDRDGGIRRLSEINMIAAMEKGLYLSCYSNVIRLTPPLNLYEDDMRSGLGIRDEVLEIADTHCQ